MTASQLAAVAENVEHAFAEAGRKLGGGLHAAYLQVARQRGDAPPVAAIKLELYALLLDAGRRQGVEARRAGCSTPHLEQHKVAIRDLPDERRSMYRHIRRQAAKPEPSRGSCRRAIESVKDGNTTLDRPPVRRPTTAASSATLNDWERDALKTALADADAVGMAAQRPA